LQCSDEECCKHAGVWLVCGMAGVLVVVLFRSLVSNKLASNMDNVFAMDTTLSLQLDGCWVRANGDLFCT